MTFFCMSNSRPMAEDLNKVPPKKFKFYFQTALDSSCNNSSSPKSPVLWTYQYPHLHGLPWWLRQQSVCLQYGRPRFNSWVGKISSRRKWQPTQVLLPGKSHGWRRLVGYSSWGHKESDMNERLHSLTHNYMSNYMTRPACISVQISSVTQSCLTFSTPCTAACQASLSNTNSQSLPKLISTESVMPSNHLILYHPLLFLPSMSLCIRIFLNESVLHIRWPKYWSFSFNISPSNEYPGLISFRMDWLDILAVQGTLKSLLQHHSSKASILLCSTFFIVQLSQLYMTTGKAIALTRWTFADKVMSLLFNMPSRVVTTFLPRSKWRLISWLQSPSAMILEPHKIQSATVSTVSPSMCYEVMGPDAMILVF